MNDSLIYLIIITLCVLIALDVVLRLSAPRRKQTAEDSLTGFPYKLSERFLSTAELNFYRTLRGSLGQRVTICAKVNLGDVFSVTERDKGTFRAYRNRIDRKHVDFLLCEPATMRPIVGIELDDSSHQREDRQARDAFVDGVFAAASLPLLHVPVKRSYPAAEIATLLAPYLRAEKSAPAAAPETPLPAPSPVTIEPEPSLSEPAPVPAVPDTPAPVLVPVADVIQAQEPAQLPMTASTAPLCPKCGVPMVLRTRKGGAKAGHQFWGCANYPQCRIILDYHPERP